MTRDIYRELQDMGIEQDDAPYLELERKDRMRQEEKCLSQYHKEAKDFIAWKIKNKPSKSSGSPLSPERTSVGPTAGPKTDQTK